MKGEYNEEKDYNSIVYIIDYCSTYNMWTCDEGKKIEHSAAGINFISRRG